MGRFSFFLFLMLTFSVSLNVEVSASICSCSLHGPEIRFPFQLTSQPEHCDFPGFELSCRDNQTVLYLPASKLELNVESIIYERQLLVVKAAQICWIDLLLGLSDSPFHVSDPFHPFASLKCSYTLMNCSTSYNHFVKISCKGSIGRHFTIRSSNMDLKEVPKACKPIKSVQLPCEMYTLVATGSRFGDAGRGFIYLAWNTIPVSSDCHRYSDKRQFPRNETGCVSREPETVNPEKLFGPPYEPPYQHKGFRWNQVVAGVTSGIFVVIAATVAAIKMYESWNSKRKKEAEFRLKVEEFLKDYKSLKPTRYTYAEIKKIANNFKNPLGQGGFGSVFKGNLPNGNPVAVKILKRSIEESEDFINEVGTIGRIHHVNVVRLLGFCADGYERALVYEFMPNESLEKFIFLEDSKRPSLGWEKLQSIAIGIARGIEYLHQGCDQRILHFDIKPHNILLDQNFNPKITDFGLAKLCSKEQSIVSMSVAKGTMGYIAPEVISRSFGNVSYKSDVYSFGVLLLEMAGGRKNINVNAEDPCRAHFPEWIYNQFDRGEENELEITEEENPLVAKRLGKAIEHEIVEQEDALIAKKLSIVALWCMQWYPVNRPSIQRVVQMLEGSIESLVMPPNPFGSTSRKDTPASLGKKSQSTQLEVIVE